MRSKNSIAVERAQNRPRIAGPRISSTTATADTNSEAEEPIRPVDGVISLSGYGIKIFIERGHLVVSDGFGPHRRYGRFSRATCGITRLVVRGTSYYLTGDAISWLRDVGASFVSTDYDGRVIAAWSPPGHNDGRLRRSQALSPWTETGLELIRYLIGEKLKGRIGVIERFFPAECSALASIRERLARIDDLSDPALIRHAEGAAGAAYWELWRTVPVTFIRRDAARIPEHWQTFGPRMSPLSSGRPRRAATPGCAALNYILGIAESETRAACTAAGLDVTLGLFHTDTLNRDSLVYDILEPIRPAIESWLLELLASQVWTRNDFAEIRDGVCRILPDLAHRLAQTGPTWYRAVAPHVEHVARTLANVRLDMPGGHASFRLAREGESRYPTRLTNENRLWSKGSAVRRDPKPKAPPRACHNCGEVLENPRRKYCADCHVQLRNERALLSTASETKRRLSLSNSHTARRAWEAEHPGPYAADWYEAAILPLLQSCTLPTMHEATGLSVAYCAQIRDGKVPHPMHWDKLRSIENHERRILNH
jgi:CRISPR-associated endonuclease Cas1